MSMRYDNTHDDRRQHKRYEGVFVEYALAESYSEGLDATFKSTFLRNFSTSGVSLFVSEQVPDSSNISVRLYDPFWTKPIDAFGSVVWSIKNALSKDGSRERYDIGIKFLNVTEKDRNRIDLMIMNFEFEQDKPYNILKDSE